MILQLAFSGKCMGSTLSASDLAGFAKSSFNGSLNKVGPDAQLGDATGFDLGGNPAQVIFGSTGARGQAPEVRLYGAVICSLISNNDVCWEILASNRSDLASLLQSELTLGDG